MRTQEQDRNGYRTISQRGLYTGSFPDFLCVKMAVGQFNCYFNKPFKAPPSVVATVENGAGYAVSVAYVDSTRVLIYAFATNAGVGAGYADTTFELIARGIA